MSGETVYQGNGLHIMDHGRHLHIKLNMETKHLEFYATEIQTPRHKSVYTFPHPRSINGELPEPVAMKKKSSGGHSPNSATWELVMKSPYGARAKENKMRFDIAEDLARQIFEEIRDWTADQYDKPRMKTEMTFG